MHLGDLRFMDALEWLARNFPELDRHPAPPPPFPTRPLPPPLPRPTRRSSPACSATCASTAASAAGPGRVPSSPAAPLYADGRGNAVFLLLGKEEEPVGAEIRGTTP